MMARLSSVLLFAAAALPYVIATDNSSSCGSGEFFFQEKSCCLPQGGQPNPPSPPSGVSCPTNGWSWHDPNQCCVPHQPQTPSSPPPQCEDDCFWSSADLKCYPNGSSSSTPAKPTTPATPVKPSAPATPASVSSAASPTASNDCNDDDFFFGPKSCCLPQGGQPNPPSPPSGVTCPTNGWYWHNDQGSCVPTQPQTPSSPPPQCNPDCFWSSLDLKCYPQGSSSSTPAQPTIPSIPATPTTTSPATPTASSDCGDGLFFFGPKTCCIPHGGQPNPPSPPSGVTCPTNGWYWHSDQGCCVPSQPQTPSSPPPQCNPDCFWSSLDLKCYPQGSSSSTPAQPTIPSKPSIPATPTTTSPATPTASSDCGDGLFFFGPKTCCIPHGGQPNPPSPPSGVTCPTNGWYWHSDQGCCVPSQPQTPSSPPPQCTPDCFWSSLDLKCYPHGSSSTPSTPTKPTAPVKPSGFVNHKRHAKARADTLCPTPMTACPIKDLMSTSGAYECIDATDLNSCGGCVSTGAGQDCNAISHVFNVACTKGACVVGTCVTGFKPSTDAKSCVPA